MADTLTITLTGRRPVKINKADWPVLAEAKDSEHDGQVECQANRTSAWTLRVREHSDRRVIVYAIYDYGSNYQGERNLHFRGGEMLDKDASYDDAVRAIERVGTWASRQEHAAEDASRWTSLVRECIADLPAELLT